MTAPARVRAEAQGPVCAGCANARRREATRAITAALPATRVIVLTTFELDEYVFGALRAGASGFLLKDIDPPDLLAAVRVVAAGEALLAPRLTRRLIEAFVAQQRMPL